MSKRSNKTRTYLVLEEIRNLLSKITEEGDLLKLDVLLDEMRDSVKATEGVVIKT